MKSLFIVIALILSTFLKAFNQNEGKLLYANRAEGANGIKANQTNIFRALDFFQKAYNENLNKEESGLFLMRCQTYIGRFIETDIEKKKARFMISRNLGESLTKHFTKSAAIRFEYITAIGLWGERVGAMKCAKDGILGIMRQETEELIKIDSMFNNASGFKILGVLNLKTPYIPLFLTWPSDKEAKKLTEKSLKYFPKDHGNNFYYAESLLKLGQKERAKIYLNAVIGMPARQELLLEDRAFQEDAKKLLLKIGN